MQRFAILIISIFLAMILAIPAAGEVLTENTSWQGVVDLQEDILVPAGITLTIEPGTIVKVHPSENTRIDPEYMSHQTEILIRGVFNAAGSNGARIRFSTISGSDQDQWAGIIIDGGRAEINGTDLSDAEAALTVLNGNAQLKDCLVRKNRYGIVAQGSESTIKIATSTIKENDYGLMKLNGALVEKDKETKVAGNSKNDILSAVSPQAFLTPKSYEPVKKTLTATYRNEALPGGYTVWKGRVLIDGQLRLPAESRLVIMPGTVVEFTKLDTNKDGIGENGLQVQGHLIAKGTPKEPIIFRSAEKVKNIGDWDSINILGSDQAQNIIEYCQIEHAYRGLHFHFSNVAVNHTILRNNYRGIQFQESLVSITNNQLYSNKSGIQTRDSEVTFSNNEIFGNLNGANFFRLNLKSAGNVFAGNAWDGVRIREGTTFFHENLLIGNRTGLLVSDAVYGSFNRNVISGNLESGLLARNADHVEIKGNAIQSNGINGISLRDTRAVISKNLINANGERGIGIISFTGTINDNNIAGNGLYAIGIEGSADIDATFNWWGDSDLVKEIYDADDEPGLGRVNYEPLRRSPAKFEWPIQKIISQTVWTGLMGVNELLTVEKGAVLEITPGTTAEFAKESGLLVYGSLKAGGLPARRITFTSSVKNGPGDWLGIRLEKATGSYLENCDLSYGEYGLHIHFVPMRIFSCRFLNNDIGIRFRSGPIRLSRSLFTQNRIGIRSFLGNMDMVENEITGNEIGVFIREGGNGVKIYRNNLYHNDRYDMRLGDFNKDDVDARENWWGNEPPGKKIFDGRMESYIGKVRFEPFLDSQIDLGLDFKGD